MDNKTGEEPSPKSNDLDGWRQAIADNRLRSFRLEEITAAFQDLGAQDKGVQNALAKYLNDTECVQCARRDSSKALIK